MEPITTPGVYNIPDHDYHADPVPGGSLSCSGAKLLLPPNCPAVFRWHLNHPRPPKTAFDLGHAAHKLVLGAGPELREIEADDWRGKAARDARETAYADGVVPLLPAEYEQVQGMAAAIRQHPIAGKIFNPARGQAEQSAFWQDRNTGIWRRARFDWLPAPADNRRFIIADYKTTRSGDLDSIQKHIWDYGYYQQAPWYCDAITALGIHPDPWFVFLFQEKTPPYLVTPVQLDATATAWGRVRNREAIQTYAECTETGGWPGYTDDIPAVSLPAWAERSLEEEYGDQPITAAREIA